VRHTAAKDRTFKTVRPNQGRLTDASRRLELDADDHVPAVRFRDPTMELTLAGRRQAMGQPRGAGMTAAHNAVLSRSLVGVPQGAPPSSALDASKETALMGDHTGAEPSARGDGARDLAASAAT